MAGATLLTETDKLRIELENRSDALVVRPVGVIDEDVNFSTVLQLATEVGPQGTLVFDMGHISRMNSCGVREWLLFVERVQGMVKIGFTNVNELFVDQANMIPQMFGKKGSTRLDSFQAPYHCPKCNSHTVVLLEPKKIEFNAENFPVAPVFSCQTCKSPLEFDWLEEEYFSFLKRF